MTETTLDDQMDAPQVRLSGATALLKAAACYCDPGMEFHLVQDVDGGVTSVPLGWPFAPERWTSPETMHDRIAFARQFLDEATAGLPPAEEPPMGEAPPEEEEAVHPDDLTPEEEGDEVADDS